MFQEAAEKLKQDLFRKYQTKTLEDLLHMVIPMPEPRPWQVRRIAKRACLIPVKIAQKIEKLTDKAS